MRNLMQRQWFQTVLWIFFVLLLVFFTTRFIGQRAVVDGPSMESTLHDGDNMILDKISYRFSDPERYDIVVFPGQLDEAGNKTMYIKRIIGLPGETVEIKDGKIYIDGLVLNTDIYAKDGITEEGSPEFNNITLKENEYYCLGDNREVSEDSRYIGPVYLDRELFHSVALHEIIGKIRIRVFPFNKIKIF